MRRELPIVIIIMLLTSGLSLTTIFQEVEGVFAPLDITIDGNTELSSSPYVTSGNGSSSNPYLISDLNLGSGSLSISNTTEHCQISNLTFSSGEIYAFDLYNSQNVRILNTRADGRIKVIRAISIDGLSISGLTILNASNTYHGIHLQTVDNFNIANSYLSSETPTRSSLLYIDGNCDDKVIQNNTFNGFNVFIDGLGDREVFQSNSFLNSSLFLENATDGAKIKENTFLSTNKVGISIKTSGGFNIEDNYFQCYVGIRFQQTAWSMGTRSGIENNTFESCGTGVESEANNMMARMYFNDFYDNYFGNCTDYAIADNYYGYDNHAYRNIFYNNKGTNETTPGPQVYQAWGGTHAYANKWSWEGEGNFWSNYVSPDVDGNGIVDISYKFSVSGEDHFPYTNIEFDVTRPEVEIISPAPGDLTSSYQRVSWRSSDTTGIINERLLIGSKEFDVTGSNEKGIYLEAGTHTLKLNVTDGSGLTNQTTMNVTLDKITLVMDIQNPLEGEHINTPIYTMNWTIIPNFPVVKQSIKVNDMTYSPASEDRGARIDLIEGPNHIELAVTDDGQLTRKKGVSVTLDTIPPVLHLISPTQGSHLTNELVCLKWSVFDINPLSMVETKFDDEPWMERGDVTELNIMMSEGDHIFKVRAADRAGNIVEKEITFSLGADPDLVILSPYDGEVTRSSKTYFSWDYSGSFNWTNAFLRTSNTSLFQNIGGAGNLEVDLVRETRTSDEGLYFITLRLEDDHGNYIDRSVVVIRDNTNPRLVFDLPEEFPYTNRNEVDIKWKGMDQWGISDHIIKIDDKPWESIGNLSSYHLDLEERTYVISIRVVDRAGNSAEFTTTFFVDRSAPSIQITGPDEGEIIKFGEVTIKWEISDPIGIDSVEMKLDDSEELDVTGTVRMTKSILVEGEHVVRINATDMCGNTRWKEVHFIIDLSDPSVEWINSPPTKTNSSSLNISWTAEDIGGIERVDLFVNGEEREFDPSSSSVILDLSDGQYKISLEVEDIAGRKKTIEKDVIVDTTPPMIDILTERCCVVDGVAEMIWEIEESTSGLKEGSVMISIDGSDPQSTTQEGRYVSEKLKVGDHTATLFAEDNAGNPVQASWEFTVEGAAIETSDGGSNSWVIIVIVLVILAVIAVVGVFIFLKKRKQAEEQKKPALQRPDRLNFAMPAPKSMGRAAMPSMKAAPGLPAKKAVESSVGNGYIRPEKDRSNEARPSTVGNGSDEGGDKPEKSVEDNPPQDPQVQKETS